VYGYALVSAYVTTGSLFNYAVIFSILWQLFEQHYKFVFLLGVSLSCCQKEKDAYIIPVLSGCYLNLLLLLYRKVACCH